MATTTTTTAPSTDVESAVKESNAIEVQSLSSLKEAFDRAYADYGTADDALRAAAHARSTAAVWMARIAYRAATHEAIATKRYPYNITGAAKALGRPVPTLRPYAIAGQALAQKDKAGLFSEPTDEERAIVEKSFDDGVRAQQKEKRRIEREKKAALEAKVATASGTGDSEPSDDGAEPVAQPSAPSLSDDTLATAKRLVAQIKALREAKEWRDVAAEVNAILAEVYPSLKS